MLRQVVSNGNPDQQKLELQKVYQWFSINKPLIGAHTKQGQCKPTLSLTTSQPQRATRNGLESELERPQTAPASLYQLHPPGNQARPNTTPAVARRPTKTFVSSFVSRSMGMDLNLIGQPFEQLRSVQSATSQPQNENVFTQPHSRPRSQRSLSSSKQSSASVLSFPTPGFLKSRARTPDVSFGEVFTLGPAIAAQMTLDNEYARQRDRAVKRAFASRNRMTQASGPGVQHRNTPVQPPEVEPVSDLPRDSTPEPKHEKTGMENTAVNFELKIICTATSPNPVSGKTPSPPKTASGHRHPTPPPSSEAELQVKGLAYRLPQSPSPTEKEEVGSAVESAFITTAAVEEVRPPPSAAGQRCGDCIVGSGQAGAQGEGEGAPLSCQISHNSRCKDGETRHKEATSSHKSSGKRQVTPVRIIDISLSLPAKSARPSTSGDHSQLVRGRHSRKRPAPSRPLTTAATQSIHHTHTLH